MILIFSRFSQDFEADEVKPDYMDDDEMDGRGTWNSVDVGKSIFMKKHHLDFFCLTNYSELLYYAVAHTVIAFVQFLMNNTVNITPSNSLKFSTPH